MNVAMLASIGGLFSILVFVHFIADWVFQSQKEATSKATDWRVRAWHCVKYTVTFWPLFLLVDFHGWKAGLATFILFFSHFLIDTYWPVMMWAKHLRKVPHFADVDTTAIKRGFDSFGNPIFTMTTDQLANLKIASASEIVYHGWTDKGIEKTTYASDEEAFKASWSAGINSLLYVTMDQLFHVFFLVPIAYMMMQ